MLLAGPDLLHGLIGTVFRFKKGPIALTADIESIFLQLKVPEQEETSVDYDLKRVAIDNEDEFPIPAKAIQNSFYMDDFIKSVNAPDEAINFLKQLQTLLRKHGFEPKTWITNCNKVIEEFLEDFRSISDTKQVEKEPSKVGLSVLGHQWPDAEDSLQVCRSTSKEAERPITQRKLWSLVSSVFDLLGLFAPYSVQMRRFLKGNWIKSGQKWDNSVEPNEEEEFLK